MANPRYPGGIPIPYAQATQVFLLNRFVNVCEFLWFHVCIAIDLIYVCDDQWWNRFCIVHEVKIVCDLENIGHITY